MININLNFIIKNKHVCVYLNLNYKIKSIDQYTH